MIDLPLLDAWIAEIAAMRRLSEGGTPRAVPLFHLRVERESARRASLQIDLSLDDLPSQRIHSTLHPERSAVPLPPDVYVGLAMPDGPDLLRRCPGAWIQAGGARTAIVPRGGEVLPIARWEAMLTDVAERRAALWRPILRRLAAEGPAGLHLAVPAAGASAHERLAAEETLARAGAHGLEAPVQGRAHHLLLGPGRAVLLVDGQTGPRPLLIEAA